MQQHPGSFGHRSNGSCLGTDKCKAAQSRMCRSHAITLRSDELCRLQVEHIRIRAGEGMQLFLPRKGDRDNQGQIYQAPVLVRLCPVHAYSEVQTAAFDPGCGRRWPRPGVKASAKHFAVAVRHCAVAFAGSRL